MKIILITAICATLLFSCKETPSQQTMVVAQASKVTTEVSGTCSGDKSCSACKNCKYCKHCSKEGGTCGVCK